MRSFSRTERSGSLVSRDHEDLGRVTEKAIKTSKDAIKISFRDIDYKVQVADPNRATTGQRHKHLHVLKKCTGALFPGQTHFIMGASGAGKTSLLNVLSDRIGLKKGDKLTGEIKFNDRYKLN